MDAKKPKGFGKFDGLMRKLLKVPPEALKRDDEIRWLEESMKRMDEADPEEIDSEEYQRILDRLVKLQKERDGK